MSQKQHAKYLDPIKSATENEAHNLGLLNPGRYCGFDTLSQTNELTFTITHQGSGYTFRDQNKTLFGPYGKWISKQGVIISEDAPIGPFTIDTNAGNQYTRYDLLVSTHTYTGVTNQPNAVYSIIKGPMAAGPNSVPGLPPLANTDTQVILGVIAIPAGAVNINQGVELRKARAESTGDQPDAKLVEPNIFQGTQAWKQKVDQINAPQLDGYWKLTPDGNTFVLNPPFKVVSDIPTPWSMYALRIDKVNVANGTFITLKVSNTINIFSNAPLADTDIRYREGYRNIVIPNRYFNMQQIISGATVYGFRAYDVAYIELQLIDNQWVVMNIMSTSLVQSGISAIIMDLGPSNANPNPVDAGGAVTDLPAITNPTYNAMAPNFPYKTMYGIPFGKVIGGTNGVVMNMTGLVRVSVKLILRFQWPLLSFAESVPGAGDFDIRLQQTPPDGNIPPTFFNLVYIERGSLRPQNHAQWNNGKYDMAVYGEVVIYANKGETLYPAMIFRKWDTSVSVAGVTSMRGMCRYSFEFLGGTGAYLP